MTEHVLKCWPEYFTALDKGTKQFELRRDDRGFRVGDRLMLREWDPATQQYSGRELLLRITYKLEHRPGAGCAAEFGLKEGYAILSVAR